MKNESVQWTKNARLKMAGVSMDSRPAKHFSGFGFPSFTKFVFKTICHLRNIFHSPRIGYTALTKTG